MRTFEHISSDSKIINGLFYLNKTNTKLPGKYIINLCEDLDIQKICPSEVSQQKIHSQGTSLKIDFLIYFQSELEECYTPLINSSFDNNIFDIDLSMPQSGFTLSNGDDYKHPFPEYINFGFAAKCQASADHPFLTYSYGKGLYLII